MKSQKKFFLDHLAQTSHSPPMLEIDRAEGVYMYGKDGKKYIDLISGIGVNNVGHRHPEVIKAIKEQLDKYLHLMAYGELVQTPQVMLAKKLAENLPAQLECTYFVNSGSEAVEGAIKLAKRFTGRTGIISFQNAYHGSTHGALSLNGSEVFKRAFRPLLPEVRHIKFNDTEDLEHITDKIAAVIIEPIQGEAGVIIPDKEYLETLRNKCSESGTLLIFDEVQTGFGRTGLLFAFEHFDVVPDILCCGKAIGGGMPLGAFISSKEIMSVLKTNPVLGHITTFGGHPICCAAGLASLELILKSRKSPEHSRDSHSSNSEPHLEWDSDKKGGKTLLDGVAEKEKLFRKLLVHPKIKAIRSKGLMMALQFESYDQLKSIIDKCISPINTEQSGRISDTTGVFVDWFLYCDSAMRIAPPLIITKEEIKEACKVILEAIDHFATKTRRH